MQAQASAFRPRSSEPSVISAPKAPPIRGEEASGFSQRRLTNEPRRAALPFPPDHPVFAGHFPGNPIIPGVQLLDRAKRMIETECGVLLCGIQAAKFLSPAGPGEALELEYRLDEKQAAFEIRCGERKIASGQFLLEGP
ncbi:MAG: hypothetical protein FWC58_02785 [Desulfobulbus sp.]|nr:hypothetical protein [Desulfobulbus sp.]